MAQHDTDIATRRDQQLRSRRQQMASPFQMLDRFADEIDRMFADFGFGRGWSRSPMMPENVGWIPQIEVSHRDNMLQIRADLPGLNKDDIKVDVTDDAIVIQGERRHEEERERDGVYRSERSYGSFYRTIPLPEGAMADQAKAVFKDGVLEVTMPAPPDQVTRGRRLEITEGGTKAPR